MESIIVVDIDGTLSLRTSRNPFEWEQVHTDVPNLAVTGLLNDLVLLGQKLFFVSGREEFLRLATETFIGTYIDGEHQLFMRPNSDYRSDIEIKRDIYNSHIKDKFAVRFVLDDRDKMIDFWRNEIGLDAWQVRDGAF